MIILGIDPGYAILGYGVLEADGRKVRPLDYGVVETKVGTPFPERLDMLYAGVNELLRLYKPDCAVFEELFFYHNATTAIQVGAGRGVAMLAAQQGGIPLYEYTPMQIKQALTGYGKADKKQMQQVVASLLRLKSIPRPDDAADALGIALCHAFTSRFGTLFSVENSTRTKGKNAVTGSYFKSAMELEQRVRGDKR